MDPPSPTQNNSELDDSSSAPPTPAGFETPNGGKQGGSRLDALKTDGGSPFDMSPKQTKLLARLHVLMRSFKELKNRVQTMQASGDGKGFTPDKQLFEKYREQKEEEIEQLKASHEATIQDMQERHDQEIDALKSKHARDMELAVAAAVERAAAEKEAAILDVDFELKQEARQKALSDSKPKRGMSLELERRQSSVALGITKALDEYPEELRGMLMMDGELDENAV